MASRSGNFTEALLSGAFAIRPISPYISSVYHHIPMAQQSGLSAFITELRRRRVFQVAAFYGGIAFVIVQASPGALSIFMLWWNHNLREAYNGQLDHFYQSERDII